MADPLYPEGTRVRVARPESATAARRGLVGVVVEVSPADTGKDAQGRTLPPQINLHVVAFAEPVARPGRPPVNPVGFYSGACLDPLPPVTR